MTCVVKLRFFLYLAVALCVVFSPSALAQTLAEALDAPGLTWSTSGTFGARGWAPQTTNTHDGIDAAVSDVIFSSSSTSSLQTTLTGPGTLSFWYSNASSFHSLTLYIGSTAIPLGTIGQWQLQTVYLPAGSQSTKWTYSYGVSGDPFSHAYLDQVSYVPGATAPLVTQQPLSQSEVFGLPVTFVVGTGGTPPLFYQWRFQDTDIPGATNSNLVITNLSALNVGQYSVTVSNTISSLVSSNAYLQRGDLAAWGLSLGLTSVPFDATNLLAISAGDSFGVFLRSNGTVEAWGLDSLGQTDPPVDLTNIISISAGWSHGLALAADGTVRGWGDNRYGQVNIPPNLSNVVAILACFAHSVALRADGTVVAWGGNPSNSYSETNVPPGLNHVVAVCGEYFNVALRDDGTITGWGPGLPAAPADVTNIIAIAAGSSHVLAQRADGSLVAWGQNFAGQTNIPANLTNAIAIAAKSSRNMALRDDSRLLSWGTPIPVPVGLSNVLMMGVGSTYNLALIGVPALPISTIIADLNVANGRFSFSVPSQSGRVYVLQFADSLSPVNWQSLPLVAGTGRPLWFEDVVTAGPRFYRVLRW